MEHRSSELLSHHKRSTLAVGIFLLVSDFAAIGISFVIASRVGKVLIPALLGDAFSPARVPIVYLCLGFVGLLFAINNLYPGYGKTAVKEIEKTSTLLSLVFLLLGGTFFFLNNFEDFPRSIFFLSWISSIIFVPTFRIIIRNRIHKYSWYGIPILIVTDGLDMEGVLTDIQRCPRMGWVPSAIFSIGEGILPPGITKIPAISSWSEIIDHKNKFGVDIAIFSAESDQENLSWLRKLSEEFRKVTLLVPYYNLGSLWIKPRDLDGHLGLEISYNLLNPGMLVLKRVSEIFITIAVMIISLPVWLIIAIWIKFDSRGPLFYRHTRIGKNGIPFNIFKFRTMVNDADAQLVDYLEENDHAKAQWDNFQKLSNDPRVTQAGKYLRKFSLDELPQLLNVIRGEMSIVGPRAVTQKEIDNYGENASLILRVKPGITGWWQVTGRNETTWEQRTKLEVYYVSNWSLWLDLYILYKTFWVVLSGTGT